MQKQKKKRKRKSPKIVRKGWIQIIKNENENEMQLSSIDGTDKLYELMFSEFIRLL